MSRGKRFSISIFGFNRKKVNQFLDELIQSYDKQLQEKIDETLVLHRQNMELMTKTEKLPVLDKTVQSLETQLANVKNEFNALLSEKNRLEDVIKALEIEVANNHGPNTSEIAAELKLKSATLDEERAKVVNIMIRADEIARQIINDAHRQANSINSRYYVNSYPASDYQRDFDLGRHSPSYDIHRQEDEVARGEARFQKYRNELMSFSQELVNSVTRFNNQIHQLSQVDSTQYDRAYIEDTLSGPSSIRKPQGTPRPDNVRLL